MRFVDLPRIRIGRSRAHWRRLALERARRYAVVNPYPAHVMPSVQARAAA